MIPDMGPHAAYIWSAYAIVAVTLAALIVWLVLDGKRQHRALAALEARGAKRR
jgi:heme exporter protein D